MFIRSLSTVLIVKFEIYANYGEEEVHDTFNDDATLGGYPHPTLHRISLPVCNRPVRQFHLEKTTRSSHEEFLK